MRYDDKYTFIKELGSGGFGKVFLAKEDVSNRLVAIKQLKYEGLASQEEIIREIELVSRLQLPNVITYHHHFWHEEALFLVMEYCAKGSLWDELKGKPANAHDAFLWTQIIAESLAYVHKEGIIHHDIKPGNILFTATGTVKISDFGIANTVWGTRTYMSPELLNGTASERDSGADIYALGVTLMEMLTGVNPFAGLNKQEILALHEAGDFPITHLPTWQQEVVLKAINKVPELRFQSCGEFAEAIQARHVPFVLDRDVLRAGVLAEKAEKMLGGRNWYKAINYVEQAQRAFPPHVAVLRAGGRYYLRRNQPAKAKKYFEAALQRNPRLSIQKELGKVHLDTGNYATAISLLSDHLHRSPSDYEAYNYLLQCFYETGRYEVAINLAKMMLEAAPDATCFYNNHFLSSVLSDPEYAVVPVDARRTANNPLLKYNLSVLTESPLSHNWNAEPTLKTKFIFQDYHCEFSKQPPVILIAEDGEPEPHELSQAIITFGREGFNADFSLPTTAVSRKHCLIINTTDEVVLYDLASTGTILKPTKRVLTKEILIGRNVITVAGHKFTIYMEKEKLL